MFECRTCHAATAAEANVKCTHGEKCTVDMCDGEWPVSIHMTPKIDESCEHDWDYIGDEPSHCKKCGLSFTRYIFCQCP